VSELQICGHEGSQGGTGYTCERAPHPVDGYGAPFRHAARIDAGHAERTDPGDERGQADLITWGEDDIGGDQAWELAWGALGEYGTGLRTGLMTEIILRHAVQTCIACPSQWDAWDTDGNYWYLRYRHGRGTMERQPTPDPRTWTSWENITFDTGDDGGYLELKEFCRHARVDLHPNASITELGDEGRV
jgi:hypothetical protein